MADNCLAKNFVGETFQPVAGIGENKLPAASGALPKKEFHGFRKNKLDKKTALGLYNWLILIAKEL
jgi:hypothetical protein